MSHDMDRYYSAMDRFTELNERLRRFNSERDWDQFHTPANIAKSIAIEAGELLECFQWNEDNYDRSAVLEELADVANYCLQMAHALDVDLIDVISAKIDRNEKKYPVEKAKGRYTKYDRL